MGIPLLPSFYDQDCKQFTGFIPNLIHFATVAVIATESSSTPPPDAIHFQSSYHQLIRVRKDTLLSALLSYFFSRCSVLVKHIENDPILIKCSSSFVHYFFRQIAYLTVTPIVLSIVITTNSMLELFHYTSIGNGQSENQAVIFFYSHEFCSRCCQWNRLAVTIANNTC